MVLEYGCMILMANQKSTICKSSVGCGNASFQLCQRGISTPLISRSSYQIQAKARVF